LPKHFSNYVNKGFLGIYSHFEIICKTLVKYEKNGIEMIKKIIIDWLKDKQNYVSYNLETDDAFQFENELAKMYSAARVHHHDLEKSKCYTIEHINSIVQYKTHHTTHYRYNFKNFNLPIVENILDKAKIFEGSKKFSHIKTPTNQYLIIDYLNELKKSYEIKKQHVKKSIYQDMFFDLKEQDIEQMMNDIFSQKSDLKMFHEFIEHYEERFKNKGNYSPEVGIFFPFVIEHDIFENKHFIFEVNPVKFMRHDNAFFDIVENFYKGYGVNSYAKQDPLLLSQYFIHPGLRYLKEYAYFDPFKNYEKYEKKYKEIQKNENINKLGFKNFIFELFELLNLAQINVIKFQHENLIDAIFTYRTKGRQKSIRELIKSEIETMKTQQLYEKSFNHFEHYTILLALLNNQPNDKAITNKTRAEKMKLFKNAPEYLKNKAQLILDNYCDILNKDNTSKLQYIYNYYKNKINTITEKYRLNVENKEVIDNMLLDLIYFYKDKSKEKLSRPFNTTIDTIYNKYQKRDVDNIIDFDFQTKFIQKYSLVFDRHRPLVLDKSL